MLVRHSGRPGQGPSLHHASESLLRTGQLRHWHQEGKKHTTYVNLCRYRTYASVHQHTTRVHIAVVVRMRLDTQYIHAERLWSVSDACTV